MNLQVKDNENEKFQQFLALNHYLAGSYDKITDFTVLNKKIQDLLGPNDGCRIFYFSLPPTVYTSVSQLINETCRAKKYSLLNSWFLLNLIIYIQFNKDHILQD